MIVKVMCGKGCCLLYIPTTMALFNPADAIKTAARKKRNARGQTGKRRSPRKRRAATSSMQAQTNSNHLLVSRMCVWSVRIVSGMMML